MWQLGHYLLQIGGQVHLRIVHFSVIVVFDKYYSTKTMREYLAMATSISDNMLEFESMGRSREAKVFLSSCSCNVSIIRIRNAKVNF